MTQATHTFRSTHFKTLGLCHPPYCLITAFSVHVNSSVSVKWVVTEEAAWVLFLEGESVFNYLPCSGRLLGPPSSPFNGHHGPSTQRWAQRSGMYSLTPIWHLTFIESAVTMSDMWFLVFFLGFCGNTNLMLWSKTVMSRLLIARFFVFSFVN
jgi:hypothetical protein